ncbi:Calcium-dependent protein kinase 8 [Nymphaea thermarum]|nr:Calcium-dependent protein kinase 8 [Nymphaea thermarum]
MAFAESIAQAIVRSLIDFKREPWPRVSEKAKDLVRRMLEPDPKLRLTALQVLEHPWVKNTEMTPNVPLGETVTARLKQFSAMNKFKKRALRVRLVLGEVVAEQLSVEEIAGIKQMFHMMDTHNKGNLSFEELNADDDGNGTLDYGKFVTVSLQLKRISSEEHLNSA